MGKVNVEMERKFVLRNLPSYLEGFKYTQEIEQFYSPSDKGVIRYRRNFNNSGVQYEKIVKMTIGKGINTEETFPIDEHLFNAETNPIKNIMKYIRKTRYSIMFGAFKIEVDVFHDMRLTMCELEFTDERYLNEPLNELSIPDWLRCEIIAEVTGMKDFNNYNMARLPL
jgi:CYTH domain-containing protein